MANFIKSPVANLDFAVDWSDWLSDGETIVNSSWASPDGLVVETSSYNNTQSVVWVSDGVANNTYRMINTITTSSTPARIDQRTVTIKVQER